MSDEPTDALLSALSLLADPPTAAAIQRIRAKLGERYRDALTEDELREAVEAFSDDPEFAKDLLVVGERWRAARPEGFRGIDA